MTGNPPLGRLPSSAIHARTAEPIEREVLDAYLALSDLTGNVSDAMDILNLAGAVGARHLRPTIPSARIAGPALTVKNRLRTEPVAEVVARRDNRLGDIEAHNIAVPGDVLVVEGVEEASSLGGIAAAIAQRQGEIGIVVDGMVRDIEASRAMGLPVWARGTTPVSGKWRVEAVGVNLPVLIQGVEVRAGDLVVADETGVCFVPRHAVAAVLEKAQGIATEEARRLKRIADGVPLSELTSPARPK